MWPTASGDLSIINQGTLSMTSATGVAATVELIRVETTSFWINSVIENHGLMTVTNPFGYDWGVRANSSAPGLNNSGRLSVSASIQAIGVEARGYHTDAANPAIFNSGTVNITGGEKATAFYLPNGGYIVNSGTINVSSGSKNYAMSFAAQGSGTIVNTGHIIVTDEDEATSYSAGIIFFGSGFGASSVSLSFINDGVISGERAIFEYDNGNVEPTSAQQSFVNRGIINGLV